MLFCSMPSPIAFNKPLKASSLFISVTLSRTAGNSFETLFKPTKTSISDTRENPERDVSGFFLFCVIWSGLWLLNAILNSDKSIEAAMSAICSGINDNFRGKYLNLYVFCPVLSPSLYWRNEISLSPKSCCDNTWSKTVWDIHLSQNKCLTLVIKIMKYRIIISDTCVHCARLC